MQQPTNKTVKVGEIKVNDQVRKTFDEQEIEELAKSIYAQGLLQPLGVNNICGELTLIFGERRYRAIALLNATDRQMDVPVKVYENLSANEILELQITENLQRKDVHPMEEAVAFNALLETMTIHDIALKLGKTERHIASRLKLCSLIPQFQEAFKNEKMSLKLALIVGKLSDASQKQLFERVDEDDEEIVFDEDDIESVRGDLTIAPFKLCDTTLGNVACDNCPLNSAVSKLLFPGEEVEKRCQDISCYENKSKLHFDRELEIATNDAEVILISASYNGLDEDEEAIQEKHGKVYTRSEMETIVEPTLKPRSEYEEELEDEYFDSAEEMETQIAEDKAEYEREMEEYNAAKLTLKKAFVISGNSKGTYIYVTEKQTRTEQKQTSSAKQFAELKEKGELQAHHIDNEIARIETTQARKSELEDQKITSLVFEEFSKAEQIKDNDNALTREEKVALIIAFFIKIPKMTYSGNDFMTIKFKQKGFKPSKKQTLFVWLNECNEEILDELILFLSRNFLIDSLKRSIGDYKFHMECQSMYAISCQYFPDKVEKIIIEQTKNRKKRSDSASEVISKLKKQKKELSSNK